MENSLRFTARLPNGRTITFRVNEDTLVRDVRDILEERLGFDPDEIRVEILRPDNNQVANLDTPMTDLILPQNRVLNEQLINIRYRRVIIIEEREPDDIVEMIGDGLLRDPTINPPSVRKMLDKIGNEKVKSIKLVRTPLTKSTKFLLNIASLGQLKNKMKEVGIDELFHLRMIINDKYTLEKNEVIKLYQDSQIQNDAQVLDVQVNKDISIKEMLDNTSKFMGSKYGSYNGKTNNCGDFLDAVLKSNGLSNNETTDFVKQKTIELFNEFPKFTEIISNLATGSAAVANKLQEGEGKCHCGGRVNPRDLIYFDDTDQSTIPVDEIPIETEGPILNRENLRIRIETLEDTQQELQSEFTRRMNIYLRERTIESNDAVSEILTLLRENISQINSLREQLQQIGGMEAEIKPVFQMYNNQMPYCKLKF